MAPYFTPRRPINASSEKFSTTITRANEYQRTGISAARLKVHRKWRMRKRAALKKLTDCDEFRHLEAISLSEARRHRDELISSIDALRKVELECLRLLDDVLTTDGNKGNTSWTHSNHQTLYILVLCSPSASVPLHQSHHCRCGIDTHGFRSSAFRVAASRIH